MIKEKNYIRDAREYSAGGANRLGRKMRCQVVREEVMLAEYRVGCGCGGFAAEDIVYEYVTTRVERV